MFEFLCVAVTAHFADESRPCPAAWPFAEKCRVGIAPVGHAMIPATDDPKDVEAARRATFSVVSKDTWNNTWWMDPIFKGCYPKDGLELYKGMLMTRFKPGETAAYDLEVGVLPAEEDLVQNQRGHEAGAG